MKEQAAPEKVETGPCCFCASQIAGTTTDPCRMTVETASGKWQVWFCHAQCFKDRLSTRPDLLGLFDPAHF